MSPISVDPIAEFLKRGGKVVKVQETIRVNADEVLEYLVNCGFRVKVSPSHPNAYVYGTRILSLSKLVELANEQRRAEKLQPFATIVKIHPGR